VKRTKTKIISDLLFCVALTSIFGELLGRAAGMIDISGFWFGALWISSRVAGALLGLYAWSVLCPIKSTDFHKVEKV
jgi:hypothetical protein